MTTSIDKTLHQFLTFVLISTLLPNLTFYLIERRFHRTFATGAACKQTTLTPPDTWSCPTLGLASVLLLSPIFPGVVLFTDFWDSNIPRYFCFTFFLLLSFRYYKHYFCCLFIYLLWILFINYLFICVFLLPFSLKWELSFFDHFHGILWPF